MRVVTKLASKAMYICRVTGVYARKARFKLVMKHAPVGRICERIVGCQKLGLFLRHPLFCSAVTCRSKAATVLADRVAYDVIRTKTRNHTEAGLKHLVQQLGPQKTRTVDEEPFKGAHGHPALNVHPGDRGS